MGILFSYHVHPILKIHLYIHVFVLEYIKTENERNFETFGLICLISHGQCLRFHRGREVHHLEFEFMCVCMFSSSFRGRRPSFVHLYFNGRFIAQNCYANKCCNIISILNRLVSLFHGQVRDI